MQLDFPAVFFLLSLSLHCLGTKSYKIRYRNREGGYQQIHRKNYYFLWERTWVSIAWSYEMPSKKLSEREALLLHSATLPQQPAAGLVQGCGSLSMTPSACFRSSLALSKLPCFYTADGKTKIPLSQKQRQPPGESYSNCSLPPCGSWTACWTP